VPNEPHQRTRKTVAAPSPPAQTSPLRRTTLPPALASRPRIRERAWAHARQCRPGGPDQPRDVESPRTGQSVQPGNDVALARPLGVRPALLLQKVGETEGRRATCPHGTAWSGAPGHQRGHTYHLLAGAERAAQGVRALPVH